MSVIGEVTAIRMLPRDLEFLSDSQDRETIRQALHGKGNDYDAFFVRVVDGEYQEVWGIAGIVPYLSKLTTRLL